MTKENKSAATSGSMMSRAAVAYTQPSSTTQGRLSPKALDVLYELGFEEGDDLTEISLVDIVAIPGGGPKIVKEILHYRHQSLQNDFDLNFSEYENIRVIQALKSAMRVRAMHVITAFAPKTIIDFLKIDWENLLTARSCGRDTFDQIISIQNDLRKLLSENPGISSEALIQSIPPDASATGQYPNFPSLQISKRPLIE